MAILKKSACGALLVALAGGVCSAQTTVDWDVANGVWSDPLSWSPNTVPNNSFPNTFIARILTPGAYTVTMDIDVTLSGFRFQAAGATLDLDGPGRSFTTTGNNLYDGIRITGSPGSSIASDGVNTFTGGGELVSLSLFTLGGSNGFVGNDDLDICDTCVDFATGSDTDWSGTGDFILDNTLAQSELVNNGTMTVSGSGSRRFCPRLAASSAASDMGTSLSLGQLISGQPERCGAGRYAGRMAGREARMAPAG